MKGYATGNQRKTTPPDLHTIKTFATDNTNIKGILCFLQFTRVC